MAAETRQENASQRAGSLRELFRIKSLDRILEDADKPEYRLRRALGPVHLTLLGIGAIIGAGIFATIGTAAAGDSFRPGAGPALMLSFVLTAVVCGFTALCYAEFASMVPISGSAYTYSYSTLGEIVAWIIGWDLIIEYAVGNIAVAISWANYFKTFLRGFGIIIPNWLSMDYRTAARIVDSSGVHTVFRDAPHIFGVPVVVNLLAVLIVAVISLILIAGIRESARFNAVMVGIKILVLTFFVVIGFMWVKPENWTPFAPNGWAGISAGAAIVFFAYIGFDAVSTVAEETRNPQRNLPIGIIASLIICTVVYILVSAVFTGLIGYDALRAKLATEQAEPLTMALAHAMPDQSWAVGIVAFGSVIAHTAVLLVFQLGQPRILFSMSRDGLLGPMFHKVHPRFRTPYVSTILTGSFVAFFAAIASIDEMVDLTNIGTLFAFILVCAGIIVLRRRDPDRPRSFRVPSGGKWALILYAGYVVVILLFPYTWWVKACFLAAGGIVFAVSRKYIFPVLGILTCLYLIYYLPPTSWLRFAAWLNVGFIIYAAYGSVHSRLRGRHLSEDPNVHDASTALGGAWLAVAGTALLFLTRGFDIILGAFQEFSQLDRWGMVVTHLGPVMRGIPGLDAVFSVFHNYQPLTAWELALRATLHVFEGSHWLEVSWFLIVPLAFNAIIFCPVVIRRSLHVRDAVPAGRPVRQANSALLIAAILLVFIIAYLLILGLHKIL
jgi:APA family basic amino acid/polyamine antiporter